MYEYTKDYDHVVTTSTEGAVATITLDSPENLNRITEQQIDELGTALEEISWNDDVRVVILTGTGPVSFGPGSLPIITEKLSRDLVTARRVMGEIAKMHRTLRTMPQPVIGVAEGRCMGGGMNLLLSTDVVIVDERATFQEVFVDYALSPDTGGMWALQRLVGPQHAKVLAMTGETIDAARAKEIGLVYEVASEGRAMDRARELAGVIASKSPLGVGHVKRLSNTMQDYTSETYFQAEADFLATGTLSHDFQEVLASATQKRSPQFKGF